MNYMCLSQVYLGITPASHRRNWRKLWGLRVTTRIRRCLQKLRHVTCRGYSFTKKGTEHEAFCP